MKKLIVNADDFGRSPGVNRGVVEAHERGIVTSASLMVRQPAAADAARYGREHARLGLGLHVDLGEWVVREGEWVAVYEVDADDLGREVRRQLEDFRRLVGREPTHLDSHQHVHLREPAASVLRELARDLGVPLRHFGDVRYCGRFYGQTTEGEPLPDAIEADALVALLASLEPGVTELACHPGYARDLDSSYAREREQEVRALCDPRVREAVRAAGSELCRFDEVAVAGRA